MTQRVVYSDKVRIMAPTRVRVIAPTPTWCPGTSERALLAEVCADKPKPLEA